MPLSYSEATVKNDAGEVLKNADGDQTRAVGVREQVIPLGPAASQIAIKQLGTNGGPGSSAKT